MVDTPCHVDAPGRGMSTTGNTKKEGGNISILLLGDEGVGKSSLVTTFVSRHFSELVPGVLTRVQLPPDPFLSNCTTTIVDTQEGDAALGTVLSMNGGNRGNSLTSINSSSADSISSWNRGRPIVAGGDGGLSAVDKISVPKGLSSSNVLKPPIESAMGHHNRSSLASSGQLPPTSLFQNIDSIVLVYDLDRVETFYRLENHWLPLIERCYNGELPVVIAGNKMDLLHQSSSVASISDNQYFVRSRQQIISLLQRFKFVRQCIKCSAKNLLNIGEVFRKAQLSVLYPITPLYDLNAGCLTSACARALTRVFRIFDADKDGLLSDTELNAFQNTIFHAPLAERDFSGWKKVVLYHNSCLNKTDNNGDEKLGDFVIRDGKFTLEGFLTIFDVFINQNRLEVPWRVLRSFGYNDDLSLNIPSSISSPTKEDIGSSMFDQEGWKLSCEEVGFLTSIFSQFDSDGDGILSPSNIFSIFSVLPTPLPPWSQQRKMLFQGSFSLPHTTQEQSIPSSPMTGVTFDPVPGPISCLSARPSTPSISASGVTICNSSLPSVDASKSTEASNSSRGIKPLSFLLWITHWHMLCAISPSKCRIELFRLGYIFEHEVVGIRDFGCSVGSNFRCSFVSPAIQSIINSPSIVIRALILGSKGCGKTQFIRKICQSVDEPTGVDELKGATPLTSTSCPETSCTASRIIWPPPNKITTSKGEKLVVHLVLTEVPDLYELNEFKQKNLSKQLSALLGEASSSGARVYDMAVLIFDATKPQSLTFAKNIESEFVSDETPRIFVAATGKTAQPDLPYVHNSPAAENPSFRPMEDSHEHCKHMDLEPPLEVPLFETAHRTKSFDEEGENSFVVRHFVGCALHNQPNAPSFRATPHGEKKRKEVAKRKKILWLGGFITSGLTVVIGMAMTWDGKRQARSDRGGNWLKHFIKLIRNSV